MEGITSELIFESGEKNEMPLNPIKMNRIDLSSWFVLKYCIIIIIIITTVIIINHQKQENRITFQLI